MKATLAEWEKASAAGELRENSDFRLHKRNGKVYTDIIPNARTETLMHSIEERVEPDSIVYTDMLEI